MEADIRIQLDKKIAFLEQNDIKMQKEISEVFDLLREVRTRIGVVASDLETRITKFDSFYKE
jgi:hypothetical protein